MYICYNSLNSLLSFFMSFFTFRLRECRLTESSGGTLKDVLKKLPHLSDLEYVTGMNYGLGEILTS